MPRTLFEVDRYAAPIFVARALSERPLLAALVAEVIALWSYVEGNIAKGLSAMMGGKAAAVIAMYNSVVSFSARQRMVLQAAKSDLDDHHHRMLRAVLKVTDRSELRNSFAHDIWGNLEKLPTALLLIESKEMATRFGAAHTWIDAFSKDPGAVGQFSTLNLRKITVWELQDLQVEVLSSHRALELTKQLQWLMAPAPFGADKERQERAFDYLYSQAEIRSKYDELVNKR